jgi:TRAP-type C4-dicarboxylate transport system permease small subunit
MYMLIFDRILEAFTAALLFMTAAITFMAVIMRYVFDSSLSWSFEALTILLTYITFVSAYLALRKGVHLRIDIIIRKMPVLFQTCFFILANLSMLCVTGVMIYWGFIQAFKFPGQVTEVMRIPVSAIYIVIPLSGTAMFAQILCHMYAGIRRSIRGMPPED